MTRPRYPSDDKPRRPGGAGPGTAQVTAIIPTALKARLDARAKAMGVSKSIVIHAAIVSYLDRPQTTTGDDAPASTTDCGASGR